MSYGQARPEEPLRNTVKIAEGADFDECPEGPQALGLVKIKNFEKDGHWGRKVGYRFIFRPKNTPAARVMIEVTNSWGSRSGLFKLVKKLSGGKLKEDELKSEEEIFNYFQRFLGHWFYATVEKQSWEAKDGTEVIFTRITDNAVTPHPEDEAWGNCDRYFKDGKKGTKHVASVEPEYTPKATSAKGDKGEPPLMQQGWGIHMYKISLAKDQELQKKQVDYLLENGGRYNESTDNWHFKEKIEDLKAKYAGEWAPKKKAPSFDDTEESEKKSSKETSFEDDEIPF